VEPLKRVIYIDAIHYSVRDNGVIRKLASIGILPISAKKWAISAMDIVFRLKDVILQLEVYQPKCTVSQKKRYTEIGQEETKGIIRAIRNKKRLYSYGGILSKK